MATRKQLIELYCAEMKVPKTIRRTGGVDTLTSVDAVILGGKVRLSNFIINESEGMHRYSMMWTSNTRDSLELSVEYKRVDYQELILLRSGRKLERICRANGKPEEPEAPLGGFIDL
jgi:hypothetical protein